jgi:Flp pilus assembly protein protease CpaA
MQDTSRWMNGLTLLWLGAAAWQNMRTRQVSNWLTIPPLLTAVVWRLAQGNIVPAVLIAAMMIADYPIVHALASVGLYSLTCVVAAVITGDMSLPIVWSTAYMASRLNLLGGADAKISMTLIAMFSDIRLAGLMPAALLAVSIIGLLARRQIRQAWGSVRSALSFQFPTPCDLETQGVPLTGALALAFALWLATTWLMWR